MLKQGFFSRLRAGLFKTSSRLTEDLSTADNAQHPQPIHEILETLEERLLAADVGIRGTEKLLAAIRARSSKSATPREIILLLRDCIAEILEPCNQPLLLGDIKPFVLLVVGVNGAGKTTTIGKITKRLKRNRKSVLLAAGDTFRAAAVEQLVAWGETNDVPVIAQGAGADSAAVIYDAFESARARGTDVLIADTAGRLHTQSNLMHELLKVKRVLQKLDPGAPHEILLVIEATTGQNAVRQAQEFHHTLNVTGLCITKLDGTAKGGMVIALADQLGIPIRYLGVGEAVEDLRTFDARQFATAMLGLEMTS